MPTVHKISLGSVGRNSLIHVLGHTRGPREYKGTGQKHAQWRGSIASDMQVYLTQYTYLDVLSEGNPQHHTSVLLNKHFRRQCSTGVHTSSVTWIAELMPAVQDTNA